VLVASLLAGLTLLRHGNWDQGGAGFVACPDARPSVPCQGPEHSSARMERFLIQCDEDPYKLPEIDERKWFTGGHLGSQTQRINWQIVNCTTPANYFHVLRRQVGGTVMHTCVHGGEACGAVHVRSEKLRGGQGRFWAATVFLRLFQAVWSKDTHGRASCSPKGPWMGCISLLLVPPIQYCAEVAFCSPFLPAVLFVGATWLSVSPFPSLMPSFLAG
jgi:Transketolase, pyrimidine binding domain